jgi:histidine triad (HIT) family protein
MVECIFCKIINGDIPSYKVYEDDEVLAFLDINPVAFGHTLVIPKEHYESVFDGQEEAYGILSSKVAKVANKIKNALNCDGINILQNNGRASGQVILHVHFHIIPRMVDDGVLTFPNVIGEKVNFEEIARKISKA